MKKLTPAEETLIHTLWKIEKGFLKDIMDAYPDPKPHHNTIATVLKILVQKGFLKVKVFGRLHRYEIKVTKEQYYEQILRLFIEEYYQSSPKLLLAEMFKLKFLNKKNLTTFISTTLTKKQKEKNRLKIKKKKREKKKKYKKLEQSQQRLKTNPNSI